MVIKKNQVLILFCNFVKAAFFYKVNSNFRETVTIQKKDLGRQSIYLASETKN